MGGRGNTHCIKGEKNRYTLLQLRLERILLYQTLLRAQLDPAPRGLREGTVTGGPPSRGYLGPAHGAQDRHRLLPRHRRAGCRTTARLSADYGGREGFGWGLGEMERERQRRWGFLFFCP